MPPPKKPKSGPTTVEQFLSREELITLADQERNRQLSPSSSPTTQKSPDDSASSSQGSSLQPHEEDAETNNGSTVQELKGHFHILRELFVKEEPKSSNRDDSAQGSSLENQEEKGNEDKHLAQRCMDLVSDPSAKSQECFSEPSGIGLLQDGNPVPLGHSVRNSASDRRFLQLCRSQAHGVVGKTDVSTMGPDMESLPVTVFGQSVINLPRLNTSLAQSGTSTFSGANQLPPYIQDSACSPQNLQSLKAEPYDLSIKKNCMLRKEEHFKYNADKLNLATFVATTQHTSMSHGDPDKPHMTLAGLYLSSTQGIVTTHTSNTQTMFFSDSQEKLQNAVITQGTPHVMSILTGKPNTTTSDPAQGLTPFLSQSSVSTDSGISGRESLPGSPVMDTTGTKSPKEENRMVSPGTCLQVQGLMPSNVHAQTHAQAPTSTTSEGTVERKYLPPVETPPVLGPEPVLKQDAPSGSNTSAKLCQVCDDNASGFHYGVWSCEGCKAFFKRSIQGPVDYVCPATNNCTIDKHRRKSCQACRLRKCYEVGMNKGSQRKERKSSGGVSGKGKRCRADSSDAAVNSTSGNQPTSKCPKRSRCLVILEALQKADLPILESYHNHSLPPTRVHLLNTLVKLADRELVYLINWAKHVPGYTDLSLSDQVHLIECCWMELLLLNCAFRSMDHEGKRLVFAPDFLLDRHHWNITGMTDILEQVAAVSEQMVQYSINKEELLLLQATVLVNAEVRRLASFSKIQEMRQMIVNALMEVSQKYHADDIQHFASMLLLLTHIRQAGERGIACFQQLKREGCVTFCDLLTEMLEAHNSMADRKIDLEHAD